MDERPLNRADLSAAVREGIQHAGPIQTEDRTVRTLYNMYTWYWGMQGFGWLFMALINWKDDSRRMRLHSGYWWYLDPATGYWYRKAEEALSRHRPWVAPIVVKQTGEVIGGWVLTEHWGGALAGSHRNDFLRAAPTPPPPVSPPPPPHP